MVGAPPGARDGRMIDIIHVMAGTWYVMADGVPHGPFSTRRDAEICAERLAGKCKDCSA
jgi:hypothetical protein